MKISSVFGATSIPEVVEKTAYYVLDSDFTHTSSDTYRMRFILQNTSDDTQGVLVKPADQRSIVRMRIYPCAAIFNVNVGIPTTRTTVNSYYTLTSTLTVLVEELNSQCYMKNDIQYHFALQGLCMNVEQAAGISYIPANPYFEWVTSGKRDGQFHLWRPVENLDSITLLVSDGNSYVARDDIARVVFALEITYSPGI